jgi:hypothetical protein
MDAAARGGKKVGIGDGGPVRGNENADAVVLPLKQCWKTFSAAVPILFPPLKSVYRVRGCSCVGVWRGMLLIIRERLLWMGGC